MDKAVLEIQAKMKKWKDEGMELAYNSGYELGYNDGYEADKTDVYNQGYADGQKDRNMDIPPSIDDAYRRGYADAEKKHNSDLDYKNGLEDGRMEAWECAKKIYKMTASEIITVFGGCSNWVDYSVDEAIEKIEKYEGGVTRQSIIKSQLEDIITGFTEPVTSQEIIDALVQIKEKAND